MLAGAIIAIGAWFVIVLALVVCLLHDIAAHHRKWVRQERELRRLPEIEPDRRVRL